MSLSRRESGIGDQISAFLGAVTIAVVTGRRLELPPEDGHAASYISQGFALDFDDNFTGHLTWIAVSHAWLHAVSWLNARHH